MSDSATPAPAAPAPGSDQVTPAAPAPVVPEGYVPAAQVEQAREEGRRAAQAEYDRRMAAEQKPPAPAPTPNDSGSDLDGFRRQILTDVAGVISMTSAAEKLRAEFTHADPGLFAPEKLAQYSSPEALRFAAEDSHNRVAAILSSKEAEIEERVRAEIAGAGGGDGSTVTPKGDLSTGGGEPTIQDIAKMGVDQLNELERTHPGLADRILLRAERTSGA